jgi:RNA polymerase sigma-70 factor (ECF subfamily)
MGTTKQSLGVRLARGEESAFAELYDTCADRLHHYLSVRLSSADGASDVLQTTFVRAVQHRRKFASVQNPVAYLFQMARNESARFASTRARHDAQSQPAAERYATDKNEQRFDESDVVAAALARLSADDRELVDLKIFAGLIFEEIAEITSTPAATIATRYRRALQSLRPWLEKQFR